MDSKSSRSPKGTLIGIVLVVASIAAGWMMIDNHAQNSRPAANKGSTDIKVTLQPTGSGGLVVSRFITCPGDKRCLGVQKLTLRDFQNPRGMMCTQQYAGPSLAWITGTINGRAVQYQLKVTNGCEIAVWNKLAPVLGLPRTGTKSAIS